MAFKWRLVYEELSRLCRNVPTGVELYFHRRKVPLPTRLTLECVADVEGYVLPISGILMVSTIAPELRRKVCVNGIMGVAPHVRGTSVTTP